MDQLFAHPGSLADHPSLKRSKREHWSEKAVQYPVPSGQKMRYGGDMTIKPLIIIPDPLLRQVSKPIETVDKELLQLADDMLETMYDAPGIGLAAIQIGVPRRLLVIDVSREEDEKIPQVFINPEIITSSDERSVYEEGCLSIPEYYAEVERPAAIAVKYIGRDGKQHEIQADGLLATCLQHEIDHLNGVLFIDHISRLKREMVIKRFTKAAKSKAV
jgi:peptide deformylase